MVTFFEKGKINNIVEIPKEVLPPLIYPNPAFNSLSVFYENVSKISQITIYDEIGKIIKVISYKEFLNDKSTTRIIDVSDLKVGLYFIQTNAADKTYVNMFIKE